MKFLKSIVFLLIFTIIFGALKVEASFSLDDLDTQISPTSSSVKIENIQNLFSSLGLYKGNIDGNYDSIEKVLLDYQLESGIIENPWDWGAGYFGTKTVEQLLEDYGDKFKNLALLYIKKEEVELGQRYFIVTAYYSPLPNQKRYLKGNYTAEVKLNGGGKITASGEGVFAGLLAAPTNYDFGTKIKLEGIGVGVVEDRGGAIVNAGERGHEYDRIDIWMGYGDEGLERALNWGRREVLGEIVTEDFDINVAFDISPVNEYEDLTLDADNPDENKVVELQELFSEVELYNGKIDGNFDSIKDELIKFQVDNNIISSAKADEAGFFGEKTLAVLRKKYGGGIFKEPEYYEHLSIAQKQKIQNIRDLLFEHIEKQSDGNGILAYKYKQSIRSTLDNYLDKENSEEQKQKIEYLKDIL